MSAEQNGGRLEECAHGLSPEWCTICLHGPSYDRPDLRVLWTARAKEDQKTDCPSCESTIFAGQRFHKLSNQTFVHEECWSEW